MPGREQSIAALRKAQDRRMARAKVKRGLREREVSPRDLLADPPEEVQTATLAEIMRHVPGIGPTKIGKALRRAGLDEHSTFGDTSMRRRARFHNAMTGNAPYMRAVLQSVAQPDQEADHDPTDRSPDRQGRRT